MPPLAQFYGYTPAQIFDLKTDEIDALAKHMQEVTRGRT